MDDLRIEERPSSRRFLLPNEEAWRNCVRLRQQPLRIMMPTSALYAGHASATIKRFQQLWQAKGLPEFSRPLKIRPESSLFPD
jgi:hypothetical protein